MPIYWTTYVLAILNRSRFIKVPQRIPQHSSVNESRMGWKRRGLSLRNVSPPGTGLVLLGWTCYRCWAGWDLWMAFFTQASAKKQLGGVLVSRDACRSTAAVFRGGRDVQAAGIREIRREEAAFTSLGWGLGHSSGCRWRGEKEKAEHAFWRVSVTVVWLDDWLMANLSIRNALGILF